MVKLYQRIQMNTTNHFSHVLPATATEWRDGKIFMRAKKKSFNSLFFLLANQQTSYMIVACDKLLKSIFSQCECLNIDKKLDVYENILSAFVQTWTSILLDRKYRYS
jgi:hypothetical protein